ncbi:hypothetical protein CMI37_24060 [Candidatus Pacearchaeota archaeon]|nr:hypothetical protein [Candidatus Pacearchaeota archaeon]
MKDTPGPTLNYGQYDPPPSWGKYFGWLFFTVIIGGIGFLGYIASVNHVEAALYAGKAGLKKKVVLEQTEGEETVITHENRKWLNSSAKEWSK